MLFRLKSFPGPRPGLEVALLAARRSIVKPVPLHQCPSSVNPTPPSTSLCFALMSFLSAWRTSACCCWSAGPHVLALLSSSLVSCTYLLTGYFLSFALFFLGICFLSLALLVLFLSTFICIFGCFKLLTNASCPTTI